MSWECKCGNESEPNQKGVISHVVLDGCIECHKTVKLPSPFKLHENAKGDKNKYLASMFAFKYIRPKG